ncbi:hydrogenase maturation protease [Pyrococcus yayanosii]|uniref:Hydrogenase-specific maturation endopeptidase n=1 Tax=Pyrococcus yayanosii (strain CH1 / JCM 16557) TaxID=529709 RepID=F8AF45_PYRYC|nr:hydrogenase maturation protease [Pyrococcus yayanosii]AEH23719.1 hydrogenase-specific maturation endopeptidase [Pyrococcus yayanosii CH1]
MSGKTLIIALGNDVMGDDGFGLRVGRILMERGHNVLEVGTDIFKLAQYYEGEERLIIIDAILSDELEPGTLVHLSGEEVFERLKGEIRSAHFMGAIDALRLLMALDERLARAEIHFVGVVVRRIELGMELSSEVEAAVPRAVELIERIVRGKVR